ncbi:MAG: trypsin-like peptidase domain-containing protein [Oscillospiraceae bacterium]|jgi:serine protease Do|nr:trypsin-like peptidase domain-containing protein [Oscillospiraceae bacterium]
MFENRDNSEIHDDIAPDAERAAISPTAENDGNLDAGRLEEHAYNPPEFRSAYYVPPMNFAKPTEPETTFTQLSSDADTSVVAPYGEKPPYIPTEPITEPTAAPRTDIFTSRFAPRPESAEPLYREPRYNEVVRAEPQNNSTYTPGIAATTPFYAPPRQQTRPEPQPEPQRVPHRPSRVGAFARAVCLALICALLGASAGILATKYAIERGDLVLPTGGYNTSAGTPLSNADRETLSKLIEALSATGEALPAELIYTNACDQVVSVMSEVKIPGPGGRTTPTTIYGSGFIISEDGYILTNHHVIEDAAYYGADIKVTLYNGTVYTATLRGSAADNDVAVLKIDATGLSAVTIGKNTEMHVGERVYAVGNPRRLDYTMTEGILSALERNVDIENAGNIKMFQISAAVNAGNSGGPVYNARGEVLGIVSAKYVDEGTEGLGFAIPIDDAMAIANELMDKGYVSGKPMLGVTGRTYDEIDARYYNSVVGYNVYTVDAGSAAEKAGILIHDTITELGGIPVTSTDTLTAAKNTFKPGDTTHVVVYRVTNGVGEYLTLTITFDENHG